MASKLLNNVCVRLTICHQARKISGAFSTAHLLANDILWQLLDTTVHVVTGLKDHGVQAEHLD